MRQRRIKIDASNAKQFKANCEEAMRKMLARGEFDPTITNNAGQTWDQWKSSLISIAYVFGKITGEPLFKVDPIADCGADCWLECFLDDDSPEDALYEALTAETG